ncbi:lipid-A-disaccharide synthase [Geothrix sp. 21YS21S-2]|uniref:lipid-A-disaccharide synthase n=1 Tax=Geothrix sp. 21YS21S-2 TaxID=3068893 RepID=UPI0027BA885A|nr:lipid-A-disaccharide synthase [Geothrix sp. 21YS21S-2]
MKPLLVIAGEASGDLHGAEILKELRALRPDLRIIGVGGGLMTPFLDRKLADVKDLGVVGFVEVIRHLPKLRRLFKLIQDVAREEGVGTVLFIDYPGLNLRLAKAFRKAMPGLRLHWYVCPQVWAWKAGRIPELGRTLDALYCLFDFEPALFQGLHVEALWVGNPLVEAVVPEVDRETFFRRAGLDPSRPLVALLPGSRGSELDRLLPPLVATVAGWDGPDVQWVLPVAPTLDAASLRLEGAPIRLVEDLGYAARAYADAALVCSGTATLETALLGTPFAIIYKLSPLTYLAARYFVRIPHFGLANVVAGREVAPELLQGEVNPVRLRQVLKDLLEPGKAASMREELAGIRARLGEPGAARRVADHLAAFL